jgi:hypothetical protein
VCQGAANIVSKRVFRLLLLPGETVKDVTHAGKRVLVTF